MIDALASDWKEAALSRVSRAGLAELQMHAADVRPFAGHGEETVPVVNDDANRVQFLRNIHARFLHIAGTLPPAQRRGVGQVTPKPRCVRKRFLMCTASRDGSDRGKFSALILTV